MSRQSKEPGMIAKVLSTSLGALFMTEEGLRKGLKPLGLPRDASKYVVKQLERRKDEMMQMVRDEVHLALSKVPFDRIAKDILTGSDIEITLRVVPRTRKATRKPAHRWKSKR